MDTKIKGYLVRDKDDYAAIYSVKPIRGNNEWFDGNHPDNANKSTCILSFSEFMFPDLKWEDEPVKVEITIKKT